jgi:hypothetical protein
MMDDPFTRLDISRIISEAERLPLIFNCWVNMDICRDFCASTLFNQVAKKSLQKICLTRLKLLK